MREAVRALPTSRGRTPIPEWARGMAVLAVDAYRSGGLEWLGGGVAAVERTMARIISCAERELILTAYTVTSGSERICDEIERALETGIRCTFIVDRLSQQHGETQALLRRLAERHAAL